MNSHDAYRALFRRATGMEFRVGVLLPHPDAPAYLNIESRSSRRGVWHPLVAAPIEGWAGTLTAYEQIRNGLQVVEAGLLATAATLLEPTMFPAS